MSDYANQSTDATSDQDLLAAVADEFAARARSGAHPTIAEYVARHPTLEERIRKVLGAIAAIEGARMVDSTHFTERVGATVGRYKLLERIGEGGFGVVYMADQQQPVRRKVALKVVKPGMDSRQVLARFEAERQALAIMDHPHIAKVFDGGMTDSGRPYFVMELVKGEPITEFCDRNRIPPRQRLELFAQVCHAVQHAHQKGIIHRDLKPSNILVMMHDTTPVVKVIDFGIAKALGHELTEQTLFTGFAQLIGTPLYMSPEQAGQSALDIDTRSDIYSLGVLLYELLTGTTPFNKERFKQAAQDEIRRIIREEEPPRPSTRLSASKHSLASISAQRQTEPGKLTRLVRGELDWIVMKALEKDRGRRYETANGFAADVQRYLADEPVLACPPSAGYRLRKFVRRNKATVAFAGLVLCFLMLLGSGIGWAVRDRSARHGRIAAQVDVILGEVGELENQQQWPEALAAGRRAEAILITGEADAATAQRVRQRLKDLNFVDQLEQVRMSLSWVGRGFDYIAADRAYARAFRDYGVDAESLPVERSIELLKAHPAFSIPVADALDAWGAAQREFNADAARWHRLLVIARAIDPEPIRDQVRATTLKPDAEVAVDLRRLAESINVREQNPRMLHRLYKALDRAKQSDSALRLLSDAREAFPRDFFLNYNLAWELKARKDYEGAVRFNTAALAIRPHAVHALGNLGNALDDQNKVDEAIKCYRKAIEIEPKSVYSHNNLGYALRKQKKYEEAIVSFRRAIEIDPTYADAYSNLGAALLDQGKVEEAIAAGRKAIELNPKHALAHSHLGNALIRQRKRGEAITVLRKTIELDPKQANPHLNLGIVLINQKQLDEGMALIRVAIELDPTVACDAYRCISQALRSQGKLDEAIAAARKAIEIDPARASAHDELGNALHVQKKLDEAISAVRRAIELEPAYAAAYNSLGNVLLDQGKLDDALAAYRKAIELSPGFSSAHANVGLTLHRLGKLDAAVAAFRRANELDPEIATFYSQLGRALNDQGKLDEAIAACRKAIELDPGHANAHSVLGVALFCQGKVDESIAAQRRTIELDPANAHAYNNLGVALEAQGKVDDAIAAHRKAIEINPAYELAYRNLGEALRIQGTLDDSIAAIRKAIELDPNDAANHRALASTLTAQKKPAEAEAAFRRAIEVDPKGPRAYIELGALLCDVLKDYEGAIACFRKAIELEPRNAYAYRNLSVALGKQKSPVEELAAIEKAVELDPENAWGCDYLASRLLTIADPTLRNFDRALPLAKKAAELGPSSHTFQTLGWALYRTGNWQGCVVALEKSIELQKAGDPWQWFCLALAHQKLGHEGEAREYYALAVEWMEKRKSKDSVHQFRQEAEKVFGVNDPEKTIAAFRKDVEANAKDVRARVRLGNALRRQGMLDDAITVCREALRLEPANADARSQLTSALNSFAWTLALNPDPQKRDPARAVTLAKESVAMDPKSADGWNTLGVAQYRAGNWTEAISSLEKYRELRTGDAEWSNPFFLAMACWRLDKKDEARRWYDKAVVWMDKNAPKSETLARFRAEAAELLGVKNSGMVGPSTAPATAKSATPEK